MIFVDRFEAQNGLITPVPFPLGIPPPENIKRQQWLLTLSGVGIINLKGKTEDWRRETVSIGLDIRRVVSAAINVFPIRRPPGTEDNQYFVAFQFEQATIFAAPSSILATGNNVNAGFAIDSWQADFSGTGDDAFTGTPVHNLFTGIKVNVAVRNDKSTLHRVSYHVTVLGKMVFIVKTF